MPQSDRIEQSIELKAPIARVWRAISDYKEFGDWFKVNLTTPFVAGKSTSGNITHPGYEHLVMTVDVQEIEPERLLSFHWHPYAIDPDIDYSHEEPTLVEFKLTPTSTGTQLIVTETGFDSLPEARRNEAYEMHVGGWAEQMRNIEQHLRSCKRSRASRLRPLYGVL